MSFQSFRHPHVERLRPRPISIFERSHPQDRRRIQKLITSLLNHTIRNNDENAFLGHQWNSIMYQP